MYDNKRSAKRKWKNALIAVVLTAGMILALPAWSAGNVEAKEAGSPKLDLTKPSALTFERPGSVAANQGKITVDLYRVADATKPKKLEGYEAYELTIPSGSDFSGLATALGKAQKASNKTTETSGDDDYSYSYNTAYRTLAHQAAGIVFNNVESLPAPDYSVTFNEKNTTAEIPEGIGSGMYLVIVHGTDLQASEYVKQTDGQYITMASNNGHIYNYQPELISLPIRTTDGRAPQGIFSTAQSAGNWTYEVTVQLKAEEEAPMHDLTITKGFTGEPAGMTLSDAFAYQVDVYLGEQLVDSHIAAIGYNGDHSVTLEGVIPEGARVVVREVYTGASFGTNETEKPALAGDNGNYTVSFTNTYNGKPGGGAVENRFKVDEDGNITGADQIPVAGTVVTQ